jgi:hypothetical protein
MNLEKNLVQTQAPYILLFFISMAASMMPTLLGALFLYQTEFVSQFSQYGRFNIYGLTVGIYFIGTTIGGLLWGMLADRLGERVTLIFCCLGSLMSAFIGIFSLSQGILALFIFSRALDGFMSGRGAVLSLFSHLKETKTIVFRKTEIMNAAGLFFGPIICGFLINFKEEVPLYYYVSPFLIIVAMNMINFFLITRLKKPIYIPIEEEKVQIKKLYKHSIFKEFLLYQVAWYFYFIAIIPFTILTLHFDTYQIGLLFSLMVVLYVLCLSITKKIPLNRLESLTIKKMAICILMISLLYISSFNTYIAFILGNIGIIFSASLLMPFYLSTMSKLASNINHGAIMGLQTSIIGISSALTAFLSGSLLNISISFPFYMSAILLFILYYFFCYKK